MTSELNFLKGELIRIREWSKDMTQTTLPVAWRGNDAHKN